MTPMPMRCFSRVRVALMFGISPAAVRECTVAEYRAMLAVLHELQAARDG